MRPNEDLVSGQIGPITGVRKISAVKPRLPANDLDGKEWTKYSVSVWSDIQKSAEEMKLRHPALFPQALVERLLKCFTRADEKVVLDPFVGTGSTVVAAYKMGKKGIGLDISREFLREARKRLNVQLGFETDDDFIQPEIYLCDARELDKVVKPYVDICITSPPYWNILTRRRTADGKERRDYGNHRDDLGRIDDYKEFLSELDKVWVRVNQVLKPGGYMIVIVMDLRKGNRFYPFHSDLASHIVKVGEPQFFLDDIIIWDRRQEYNNLRPLGYPSTFRINKVHEFILIFRKPLAGK